MFHFICKRIFIHVSPAQKLQYLQKYTSLISLKYISSTTNQHSFTVSYLINSCGLSLESAVSASKHVHFEAPHKPDSVLDFLQNHGFSKSQITVLTKRFPQVILSSPEKTLLPKFEFFHSKGISNPDIVNILSLCPGLLHRSLDNHLIPTFNSLSNLFQSSKKVIEIITGVPRILYWDLEDYVLPNFKILQETKVPVSNIVKLFYGWPELCLMNPKHFEKNVAVVKEMGINPLRLKFVIAIRAKCIMSESLWESKLNVYKRWGWSEEDILAAFAKYPWCMIASMDKITAAMEFFVNEMGWESSVLVKHPILILFSLEKRIIPRVAVIQFLLSKGLMQMNTSKFIKLLLYPENIFVQRFMNSYDEAPQLLKLYNEKMILQRRISVQHE